MREKELTILMPCLNEERTLAACIAEAKSFTEKACVDAEILIADNGSTDSSAKIAEECGARVVKVFQKGYGNALRGGISEAKGKYIIMGDCDGSYNFENCAPFLEALRAGAHLAVGNRFFSMEKGAMPFLHRYFGVPLLSFLGRVRFSSDVFDFHCGLRGIDARAFDSLNLQSTGMEFATEMIAKASRAHLTVVQVPIFFRRDKRNGKSHLRTLRDGIRHIIYILKG